MPDTLSLPQTWLLFWHEVLLVPTCLLGLESCQVLRRIDSNAVLSLLWLQLGQTKQQPCMLAPMISEMSQLPNKFWGCLTPKLCGQRGGRTRYLGQRTANKTINFFSHFHALISDTNYKHLECFVMLGTHSELRMSQMSHVLLQFGSHEQLRLEL